MKVLFSRDERQKMQRNLIVKSMSQQERNECACASGPHRAEGDRWRLIQQNGCHFGVQYPYGYICCNIPSSHARCCKTLTPPPAVLCPYLLCPLSVSCKSPPHCIPCCQSGLPVWCPAMFGLRSPVEPSPISSGDAHPVI